MFTYSNNPKRELLAGAIIAALAGGAAYKLLTVKSGKKSLQGDFADKCEAIRNNVENFLESLEKNVTKRLSKKNNAWADTAKDTVESLKEWGESVNITEHKELGMGILAGALIGISIAASATWLTRCKEKDEGILQNLGNQIATWKPLLIEVQNILEERGSMKSAQRNSQKMNNFLECATAGLKLWNNLQKRR